MTGAGRLAPLEAIAAAACEVLGLKHDFANQTVLVTAGPTQEEHRFRALHLQSLFRKDGLHDCRSRTTPRRARGASERTQRSARAGGVDWVPVKTAAEMRARWSSAPAPRICVIKAAAVSDYRVALPSTTKMKRESGGRVTLELEPTADLVGFAARNFRATGCADLIGFAAETDHVANMPAQLARKGADIIVANDITQKDAGFDTDTNIATLFFSDGREVPLPKMSKFDLANQILDRAIELRQAER